jgi:hypothetical protein
MLKRCVSMNGIDNNKAIYELTRDMSKLTERVAILETNNMHIMTSLSEIKSSLTILIEKSNNNNNNFTNSKNFIGGIVATVSIAVTILSYFIGAFINSFKGK